MNTAADLLQQYLRQRRDLGEVELVLDDAGVVLRALEQGKAGAGEERAAPEPTHVPAGGQTSGMRPGHTLPSGSLAAVADELGVARPGSPRRTEPRRAPSEAPTVPPVPLDLPANHPLKVLSVAASGCTACGLASTRTTVVFGEGNPQAQLMVVGEAPGAEEDRTGRPFVGRAGALLNTLLQSIGFPRESVYICNVLKCRPPGNRNPLPAEVEACSAFLRGQLKAISPRAILTVGTFPSQALLQTNEAIGRLRGTIHSFEGTPLVPTYHPAALLRNPGWIRPVWEDLQKLRRVLDAG